MTSKSNSTDFGARVITFRANIYVVVVFICVLENQRYEYYEDVHIHTSSEISKFLKNSKSSVKFQAFILGKSSSVCHFLRHLKL